MTKLSDNNKCDDTAKPHTHLQTTLLYLSSWCLVMVERLFLAVPRGCLQFVIVVFPDHTHLLFLTKTPLKFQKAPAKIVGEAA